MIIILIWFKTEYDDGDGDGESSFDNSYNFSAQQSTAHFKRKHENGATSNEPDDDTVNDETDEPKGGESSTSAESVPKKKRRKEFLNLNATFMAGIQGVKLVIDQV